MIRFETTPGALALALITCLGPVLGQEPEPDPEEPPLKLQEWPTLRDKTNAKKEVTRLRRSRSEEVQAQSRAALRAEGAAAAPLLLAGLDKEQDGEARARLEDVLREILGHPHTRLLAGYFDHKSSYIRCWTMRQVSRTPDRGLRSDAQARWKKLGEARKKPTSEELYATSMLLTSTGDLSALKPILERVRSDWKAVREELTVVGGVLRSQELGSALSAYLVGSDRRTQVATLKLIGVGGSQHSLSVVVPYLDSTDSTLRIAAINACRAIVDGAPPLDKLAVFEAIERAKAWKSRLQ